MQPELFGIENLSPSTPCSLAAEALRSRHIARLSSSILQFLVLQSSNSLKNIVKMVAEQEGTFEVNGHSLYTKCWLVRRHRLLPCHRSALHALLSVSALSPA